MKHSTAQTIFKQIREENKRIDLVPFKNDFALDDLMHSLLNQYRNVREERWWTSQHERRLYTIMLEWCSLFTEPARRIRWIWDLTDIFS